MENPPKRPRLSRASKRLESESLPGANGSILIASVGNVDDEDNDTPLHDGGASDMEELQDYVPSFGRQFGSPEQLLAPPAPTITSSANFERDEYLQEVESVVNAVETVIASVFDVIIDSGTSAIARVTLTALPTAPAVISVPSFGSLTVSPPVSTDVFSTQGGTPAPSNAPSESSIAASSSASLSITVPNSSSQITLSSPPSTPLPSGSSMTLPSSFTNSFFPSSTTEPVTSGESLSATSLAPASFSSFILTGNLTTSSMSQARFLSHVAANLFLAFTSTNAGTTFTGTTTLNSGSFPSNATQLTSLSTSPPTSVSSSLFTSRTLTGSTSRSASQSSQTSQSAISTTQSSTISPDSTSSSVASSTTAGASGIVAGPGRSTENGTPTSTASPSSTPAAGSGSNQSSAPPTPAVVGGVVGGLAGLTVLLVILLFILRWRRRKLQTRQVTGGDTEMAGTNPSPPSAPVTQRSTPAPLATAGLAPFLQRLRSRSGQTATTIENAPSERGFQKLGGRRIESVLTSGGDGYGGPGPANLERENNLSGSSFYRDSQGTYGGPGSLPSSMYVGPGSPPLSPVIPGVAEAGPSIPPVMLESHDRPSDQEIAVMRPSPARTPVTSQAAFTSNPPRATPPPRAPPSPRPPPTGDGIGRSHPSLDGSRSRFAENLS